jgi:hypothetical protein
MSEAICLATILQEMEGMSGESKFPQLVLGSKYVRDWAELQHLIDSEQLPNLLLTPSAQSAAPPRHLL